MFLILLVVSNIAISQENKPIVINGVTLYPFTGEELDRAYFREKQATQDLELCREASNEFVSMIVDLNKDIKTGVADLQKIKDERDVLQKEKTDAVSELAALKAKRPKHLSIGPAVIIGPDLKIRAGVGVTYKVFSF